MLAEPIFRDTRTVVLEMKLADISKRAARGLSRPRDVAVAAEAERILEARAAPKPATTKEPAPLAASICMAWRAGIDEICRRHGMTFERVMVDSKVDKLVHCRHEIWWWLHRLRGTSLPEIGRRFGGFHHTTVLHGVRKHEERMAMERLAA